MFSGYSRKIAHTCVLLQDVVEGDEEDEEEEEEEEEEADGLIMEEEGHGHKRGQLRPPTPIRSARTSPTSSAAPRTPREATSETAHYTTTLPLPMSSSGNKVTVVKQWTPRAEHWAVAA